MMRLLHRYSLIIVVALLGGCASVDFSYPRPESTVATGTDDTYLGQQLEGLAEFHPDESGFYPLSDGIDALASRLLLAEMAERSIDVQYYLIKSDITSHAFLNALLRAADRGVRVRFLLDDVLTNGYDASMAGLDSHPNIEIRFFNPFAYRSARFADAITGFSRVNRRMHNKSFTIDNQITIIGGRNIADEYFAARVDVNFGDLDVMAIGPIVADISAMFDSYWNHERAAALAAFAKMPDDPAAELERVRAELEASRQEIMHSEYANAVTDQVLEYVETDTSMFTWAPYVLAVDSPDKAFKSRADSVASIMTPLRESILAAQSEVIIISPYFVPRKYGIEAISALQDRGVAVTVITNSLAANNHTPVHGGYAPSRKPLLKSGVRIFEFRADAEISGTDIAAADDAIATLHTKAFIVDGREIFIGSFNFDPRSANINTELGVIIESPELAQAAAIEVKNSLAEQTYEVFLNDKGKLRWRALENGQEVVYDKEPKTTWSQRFIAGFARMLPIRGQL
jgi:putative cardiolipin synthase